MNLSIVLIFFGFQLLAQSGNVKNSNQIDFGVEKGNLIIQTVPLAVSIEIPRINIVGDKFQDSLILEEIYCGEYELVFGRGNKTFRFKVDVLANKTIHVMVYVERKWFLTKELDYAPRLPEMKDEYRIHNDVETCEVVLEEGLWQNDSKKDKLLLDEEPRFPGGSLKCQKWVAKRIRYPIEAQKYDITGRVYISFVINEDGSISDVKSVKPVHPLLEEEGVRVVKEMPKWKSGKLDGKSVKVSYTIPINFDLQ